MEKKEGDEERKPKMSSVALFGLNSIEVIDS